MVWESGKWSARRGGSSKWFGARGVQVREEAPRIGGPVLAKMPARTPLLVKGRRSKGVQAAPRAVDLSALCLATDISAFFSTTCQKVTSPSPNSG